MHGTYEFRREMMQIHRPDIADPNYVPKAEEIGIDEDWSIVIAKNCGQVLLTAAQDLQDYLLTSLNVSVAVKRREKLTELPAKTILIATCDRMETAWEAEKIPASYRIAVSADAVVICGIDERGCAQGCYQLEDRMNSIRAPYLSPGSIGYAPEFSPRMIHSGYQMDRFPDEHLSAIAHAGMDAIVLFVSGMNRTPTGYLDFNELIFRAEKYGLDVYAYSYFKSTVHPDEPAAEAEFESTYGALFRACPGFKGVILVGESVEFPSRDPRVSELTNATNSVEGIPTGMPTAGWFPCNDYYKWLNLLKTVVQKYRADADIVFWTYNWGYAPEEDRLALIDSLPADISLMATFEMFEDRFVDGIRISACDYTLSFPEAGVYFVSEAKRAKERGIRLYTQANSAGLTWDFGVIPYEPFPYQWAKRYRAMLDAKKNFGLCGVMESHHYGFWPSFISKLEKLMFTAPCTDGDAAIRALALELYGEAWADKALQAWATISSAMEYYVCTNEDQYGPFRVGPAYPLVYNNDVTIPSVPYAHFPGNKICKTDYAVGKAFAYIALGQNRTARLQQRHPVEAKILERMEQLLAEGRAILEQIAPQLTGYQQEDCLRLCNLVHFIEHCARTTIHVKQWSTLRAKCRSETDSRKLLDMHHQMVAIGEAEIRNAEETIPLVQYDSRLGWEPSMEYIGGEYHLRWKMRQVRQVIDQEIALYDQVIRLNLDGEGK